MLVKSCVLGKEFPFEEYEITDSEIYVKTGLFSKREDCVDIRKIYDVAIITPFISSFFNQSTIVLYTRGDSTDDIIYLKNVKNAKKILKFIKSRIEYEFKRREQRTVHHSREDSDLE